MTFVSVSPYHLLNRAVPKGKDKYIYKITITMRAQFCNSKFLFHKISVRSNTVFYDLGPFIILKPIPPFLFKASNLELYFGIFLQLTQPVCCKTVARLKH